MDWKLYHQPICADVLHDPAELSPTELRGMPNGRQGDLEPHEATAPPDIRSLWSFRLRKVQRPPERPGQAHPTPQAPQPFRVSLSQGRDECFHLALGDRLSLSAGLTRQLDWGHPAVPPGRASTIWCRSISRAT